VTQINPLVLLSTFSIHVTLQEESGIGGLPPLRSGNVELKILD
jgi:hypothetical protein